MLKSVMGQKRDRNIFLTCAVLAAAIFLIDLQTPRGIADAVSYVALVVLTLWSGKKSHTLIMAMVGTILTIAGIIFSPPGEAGSIFVTNRVLALLGIWMASFVILRFKKKEAEAKRMSDSLDALFMHATEGIIISDRTGKIVRVNPQAEKQFGYGKDELHGKNIDVLVPPACAHDHAKKRESYYRKPNSRAMGHDRMPDLKGLRKNGEEFPVEISLSNYELEGETFVVAFVINITARKKQEEQLKRSHEELRQYAATLKETNAELENFAYISSHDLQEPLRKIQSFGDRLKNKEKDLSEEGADYLQRMMNAAQRMQRLINDLLSFSRLTSRSQRPVLVDLKQVADEVLLDLEVAIDNSKAKVEVGKLPLIEAEPVQMRQLFQNLVGNAIKFRKDHEPPKIRVSAESLAADGQRDFVMLKFEDNGIGFDEKYLDKIFGIFQRLDGTKYEGSGIGLAICKKIALRHGGMITAQSAPGHGSTFIITLPVTQPQKN